MPPLIVTVGYGLKPLAVPIYIDFNLSFYIDGGPLFNIGFFLNTTKVEPEIVATKILIADR